LNLLSKRATIKDIENFFWSLSEKVLNNLGLGACINNSQDS